MHFNAVGDAVAAGARQAGTRERDGCASRGHDGGDEVGVFYPRMERNGHMEVLLRHFGRIDRAPADVPAEIKFVFLCYTNRCGSNFLADLLVSTRRFRRAGEFLNHSTVVPMAIEHGHRSIQEYFSWQVRRRATGRNIVACKLAIPHLEMLGESGLLDQILNRSRFVFLTREDTLGQAISFEIARQTGLWSSRMPGSPNSQLPVYNARRLRGAMASIRQDNHQFEEFFGANRIDPVHVVYERLVVEPEPYVREIGRTVGLVGLKVDPTRMSLQRQSNSLNSEWAARFQSESATTPFGAGLGRILSRIGDMKRVFWP